MHLTNREADRRFPDFLDLFVRRQREEALSCLVEAQPHELLMLPVDVLINVRPIEVALVELGALVAMFQQLTGGRAIQMITPTGQALEELAKRFEEGDAEP